MMRAWLESADAGRAQSERPTRKAQEAKVQNAVRYVMCHPPSGTLAELLSPMTDGRRDRLRPCDLEAMVSPDAVCVKG